MQHHGDERGGHVDVDDEGDYSYGSWEAEGETAEIVEGVDKKVQPEMCEDDACEAVVFLTCMMAAGIPESVADHVATYLPLSSFDDRWAVRLPSGELMTVNDDDGGFSEEYHWRFGWVLKDEDVDMDDEGGYSDGPCEAEGDTAQIVEVVRTEVQTEMDEGDVDEAIELLTSMLAAGMPERVVDNLATYLPLCSFDDRWAVRLPNGELRTVNDDDGGFSDEYHWRFGWVLMD